MASWVDCQKGLLPPKAVDQLVAVTGRAHEAIVIGEHLGHDAVLYDDLADVEPPEPGSHPDCERCRG
jgi:hypothetical protein